MITELDQPLIDELALYRVRFCCDDCIHYEPDSAECSLGYPTLAHRAHLLTPGRTIIFCKTFELG